ncbi:MAG: hypothetical protein OEM38_09370, partial [Gammaproteobacteria bacterium]|nr:hypothetical protein [Gammaproteobacteria bacterium]
LANTEQKECNEPVVEIEHAIMVVGVNKLLDFISLRNEVNVMEMKQFTKHENKYVRAQMSS